MQQRMAEHMMKNIDESRLENDLAYRFNYLADFMQFGAEDVEAILGAAGLLGPLVPALVEEEGES